MGQSSHTECQGGCQQACCPIRRALGSRVSHALGGLQRGPLEGEKKKTEGWTRDWASLVHPIFSFPKQNPFSLSLRKIPPFDPGHCPLKQRENKKWLFNCVASTIRMNRIFLLPHVINNHQLRFALFSCLIPFPLFLCLKTRTSSTSCCSS